MIGRYTGYLLLAASLSACGNREIKTGITPTHQSIQSVVIQSKCLECHTSLSSYEGVLAIVEPGNPEKSDFYREIRKGSMPLHSPKLSDAEIQAVYDWIKNGAQND